MNTFAFYAEKWESCCEKVNTFTSFINYWKRIHLKRFLQQNFQDKHRILVKQLPLKLVEFHSYHFSQYFPLLWSASVRLSTTLISV